MPLNCSLTLQTEGTSPKIANYFYAVGSNWGDSRRKSTPSFTLCRPVWADRLSTMLIWCCTLRIEGPTCKIPCCKELIEKKSVPLRKVKPFGNGGAVAGTEPPKLSTWP